MYCRRIALAAYEGNNEVAPSSERYFAHSVYAFRKTDASIIMHAKKPKKHVTLTCDP